VDRGQEGGLTNMPKLPKGMFKRGRSFYVRRRETGKDRWHWLGNDYEDACRKLRQLRSLGERTISHLTVCQAAEEWFRTYVPNARSPYGVKQTEDRIERFLEPFLGHLFLHRLGPQDLRAYRLWLEAKNLAPLTVKHILGDARCLLNWAEDAGYLDRSPFPKRIMPRIEERPPDRLTDEEVERVVRIPDPHGFVVRLALATGLRWGELTRAMSSDVEHDVLVVHRTKSGKVRRIPIPAWFQSELRHHVGKLVPFASPGQFNAAVRRLSDVERYHVHQLRHTFACRWLERGGSLPALQQLLGHSSVVTTQRYGRLSDESVRREVQAVASGDGL